MKKTKFLFCNFQVVMLSVLFSCIMFACSSDDNPAPNPTDPEAVFQKELDEALSLAKLYGPETQEVAELIASRHKGLYTTINYKTRESTERKCRTDHHGPFEISDLARTMIICHYDSLKSVMSDLENTMKERNKFDRHKHQTSDYGYWGDLFNMQFPGLKTEIQVKCYSMFYATQYESVCRSVLGDSIYNVIRTTSGQEPSMLHEYYEIMRADTTSAATYELYRQKSLEYSTHFDPDYVK